MLRSFVVGLNAAQTERCCWGARRGCRMEARRGGLIACATVHRSLREDMEGRRLQRARVHLPLMRHFREPIKPQAGRVVDFMAAGTAEAFAAHDLPWTRTAERCLELERLRQARVAIEGVKPVACGRRGISRRSGRGDDLWDDPKVYRRNVSGGLLQHARGTSWMLENQRAAIIVAGDYTPHSSVNIWPKDLGIVLDIAKSAPVHAARSQPLRCQQFLAAAGQASAEETRPS